MDYISLYWFFIYIAMTPVLHTAVWIDIVTIPIWISFVTRTLYPWLKLPDLPIPVIFGINSFANSFAVLLIAFVLFLKARIKVNPYWILKYLGWANIFLTFLSLAVGSHFFSGNWAGIAPNRAMNAVLIVMLMPYLESLVALVLSLIVVFQSTSFSAGLALSAMATYFIYKLGFKRISLFSTIPILGIASLMTQGYFDDTGRFEAYKTFIGKLEWHELLFGTGPGSFQVLGPYIQKVEQFRLKHGFYLWLHSDPLQCLFELGILQSILIACFIYFLFKKSALQERLTILAFLAGGMFYYTAHMPPHLLVIFLVIKITYDRSPRLSAIIKSGGILSQIRDIRPTTKT